MVNQSSLNELALFAGAGGGILGGKLLGWRTVCAVEWESYPASVLCARQNDGVLPPFPIWDDVQTFDGRPWAGIVDVVSGGFPCQDISAAGKGAGIDGERSGMWGQMARIIHEVRPRFVFVENSPMLTSRGLGRVLGDLASMGFDARWGVLGAADVGANHQRDRIWIVGKMGNANNNGQTATKVGTSLIKGTYASTTWSEQTSEFARSSEQHGEMAYTKKLLCDGINDNSRIGLERKTKGEFGNNSGKKNVANSKCLGWKERAEKCRKFSDKKTSNFISDSCETFGNYGSSNWWSTEPDVGRVVNGMASRVDRLKAIGNGQVPLCAATAWRILNDF